MAANFVGGTPAEAEYLRKHNVAHMVDNIVVQLLQHKPENPAEFIKEMNISAGGLEKASVSFRVGNSDKKARTTSAETSTLPGIPVMSTFSPRNAVPKGKVKKIKEARKELYDSFATAKWPERTNVKCAHIGCLALATNYLLKTKRSDQKHITTEDVFFHSRLPLHYTNNNSITIAELHDIALKFSSCDSRFRESNVSLVCFETLTREDGGDPLAGSTVGTGAATSVRTAETNPAVTLPPLRYLLENCVLEDNRAIIFNYDPLVAADGSHALEDEEEEEEDEMETQSNASDYKPPPSPSHGANASPSPLGQSASVTPPPAPSAAAKIIHNRGAYAVFTDFNTARHVVNLAEVAIDTDLRLRYSQVMLPALYTACSTSDTYSHRARGYIEIKLGNSRPIVSATGQAPVLTDTLNDETSATWSAPFCIDNELLEARPGGAIGTNLVDTSNVLASHIIGVALAVHVACGTNEARGINIGDIMQTCGLTFQIVQNPMPFDEVQHYCHTYLEKRFETRFSVSRQNINLRATVEGEMVTPSMSVMHFESYLCRLTEVNNNPKEPDVVMLLNFDASVAHSVAPLDDNSDHSHWAIVASYDQKRQMVRLADTFPKKYCRLWQVPLTRLHTALLGKGFLVITRTESEAMLSVRRYGSTRTMREPSRLVRATSMRLTGTAALMSGSESGVGGDLSVLRRTLGAFEFSTPIFCPSIIALAFTLMGHHTLLEDVVLSCGIDISFLLSDHISSWDVARCASYVIRAKDELKDIRVSNKWFGDNLQKAPHVSLPQFTQMIAETATKDRSQYLMVVNFSQEICHAQYRGVHNGGSYGIVLGYDKEMDMVTMCDLNPIRYYRVWTIPTNVLYEAIRVIGPVSGRARGVIIFEQKPGATPPLETGRHFDIRKTKIHHPFKVPTSPQLTALAFAISEMGPIAVSAEDIFYTAYDNIMRTDLTEQAVADLKISGSIRELFSLSLLCVRCKLTDMVALAKSFLGDRLPVTAIIMDPANPISVEQFESELKEGAAGPHILIAVYLPSILYDASETKVDHDESIAAAPAIVSVAPVGTALIRSYTPATHEKEDKKDHKDHKAGAAAAHHPPAAPVTPHPAVAMVGLSETNTTAYGEHTTVSVETLRKACVPTEAGHAGLLGLVRVG